MRYLVVVERGDTSWGAFVPDLPGCVAVGGSEEEVMRLIHEAVDQHLEIMADAGQTPPAPRTHPRMVEVAG